MLGGAGKGAGRHPGSAVPGPGVWILVLAPSGPSDRRLRAHSGSPGRDAEAVSEEGCPGRGSAPAFGGAPSHCQGDPSPPALPLYTSFVPYPPGDHGATLGTLSAGTQACRDMWSERACPSKSASDPDDDPDGRDDGAPGQGVGPFSTGQGSPACSPPLGPRWPVAGLRPLSMVRSPVEGAGRRVGPAEMS